MPRHCSVYGCFTNYKGRERASTFTLPKTEPLRSLWLMKIPTDLSKLKNPVICINHFQEDDIIRTDTVPVKGVMKTFPRKIPKLKEDSFPCIFPVIPDFMKEPDTSPYSSDNEEDITVKEELTSEEYSLKESINCLDDINYFFKEKFEIGCKWTLLKHESKIILCLIQIKDDLPTIVGNITVNENLEFSVFVGKAKITNLPCKEEFTKLNSFNDLEQLFHFIEEQVGALGPYVHLLDKLLSC